MLCVLVQQSGDNRVEFQDISLVKEFVVANQITERLTQLGLGLSTRICIILPRNYVKMTLHLYEKGNFFVIIMYLIQY